MYMHQYLKERFKDKPEENSGESLVEKAGYVSAQKRIENLILAGHRLQEYRKSQFDFESEQELDEDFSDPTRAKNFDLADGFQLEYYTNQKLKAQERAIKASQKAQEASDKALKEKTTESTVE